MGQRRILNALIVSLCYPSVICHLMLGSHMLITDHCHYVVNCLTHLCVPDLESSQVTDGLKPNLGQLISDLAKSLSMWPKEVEFC